MPQSGIETETGARTGSGDRLVLGFNGYGKMDRDISNMPGNTILHSDNTEGIHESVHIIGFFPTKFNPHIPDEVLIETNGTVKILSKNRTISSHNNSKFTEINIIINPEEWITIDGGKVSCIKLSDIDQWCDRVATELVQQALKIRGQPLTVLVMLESAAKLRSLNLADFVSVLKTQRTNEDESLENVFLRVKDNQMANRTG